MKRQRGFTIWLVVLCTLVIIGIVLDRTGHLGPAEGSLYRVLVPIEGGMSGSGSSIRNFFSTIRDLSELREQNELLTEIVNELVVENVRLKEMEAENETLRRLLDFADSSPGREFKATEVRVRVVSWEPNNLLQYIVIAAGSEDGIAPGMPVVTERGLVGRVETVMPKSSRVRLIIDADSSVNALVQRTRATGIVKGKIGGRLELDFLSQGDEIVAEGDLVLTSGLGGNFPRQIVIGQVVKLEQNDYEMFQRAEIRPTVDFDRLEIVLVITNFIPLQ